MWKYAKQSDLRRWIIRRKKKKKDEIEEEEEEKNVWENSASNYTPCKCYLNGKTNGREIKIIHIAYNVNYSIIVKKYIRNKNKKTKKKRKKHEDITKVLNGKGNANYGKCYMFNFQGHLLPNRLLFYRNM